MSAAAGTYAGLDRFEARKRVVADLEALGLLEHIADHTHAVGVCDRCRPIVEPRISTQWFVKMKPLAEPAMAAVARRLIEVVPENRRTILLNWMRQHSRLVHFAPALVGTSHSHLALRRLQGNGSRHRFARRNRRRPRPRSRHSHEMRECGGAKLTQDTDVLDTWFSSALWPFSTLGWPDDTRDLRDILSHQPADQRLRHSVFLGRAHDHDGPAPYRRRDRKGPRSLPRLYLHSLVRTAEGAKMSKTKGTGVDPLELTQKFGTDAMRFTLASMAAPGTDIVLSEDRILSCRAFANKIWNAARFVFVNLEKVEATAA